MPGVTIGKRMPNGTVQKVNPGNLVPENSEIRTSARNRSKRTRVAESEPGESAEVNDLETSEASNQQSNVDVRRLQADVENLLKEKAVLEKKLSTAESKIIALQNSVGDDETLQKLALKDEEIQELKEKVAQGAVMRVIFKKIPSFTEKVQKALFTNFNGHDLESLSTFSHYKSHPKKKRQQVCNVCKTGTTSAYCIQCTWRYNLGSHPVCVHTCVEGGRHTECYPKHQKEGFEGILVCESN